MRMILWSRFAALTFLAFAVACEQPKATFEFQLESCIEGAQSMKLDITTSSSIAGASITATSSNVNDADIESTGPGQFTVVAHFNALALHEVVEITLECGTLGSPPREASVSNAVFYPTPEPGTEDPCPPSGTPTVTVLDATDCGAKIELSNTHNPAPSTCRWCKKTRRPGVHEGLLVLSRPVADRRVVSWANH